MENSSRPYKVDVPVRIMIWTRPDCQRKQFEVIRQAAPSILFLISDGGRNEDEKIKILECRKIFEEIDWNCKVYKLYFEENQGMYTMMEHTREFIWSKVDRCILLEDDYIPAVSFFSFCAELLEKYKDDERIEMICGNNPFEVYPDAEPYDYFFTENGWSIWGTACWKRTVENRNYPFDYSDSKYIRRCLNDNATWFWRKKINNYCNGKLDDNHVPGSEYYIAANSILFHRLCIVPTKNMIQNIGFNGAHFSSKEGKIPKYLNVPIHEVVGDIKHPKYIIDDKHYSKMYEKLLNHCKPNPVVRFVGRSLHFMKLVFTGKAVNAIMKKIKPEVEK